MPPEFLEKKRAVSWKELCSGCCGRSFLIAASRAFPHFMFPGASLKAAAWLGVTETPEWRQLCCWLRARWEKPSGSRKLLRLPAARRLATSRPAAWLTPVFATAHPGWRISSTAYIKQRTTKSLPLHRAIGSNARFNSRSPATAQPAIGSWPPTTRGKVDGKRGMAFLAESPESD